MSGIMILFLVIGLPLLLIGVGFILLVTKAFGGQGGQAEQTAKTLETARRLEETLSSLETRLTALEDIILAPAGQKNRKEADHE